MTTDVLIPLGLGSRYDNIELRYCLRSIAKHVSGVGAIVIVGERPEWLRNIVHIPAIDSINGAHRAFNIYNKIIAGLPHVTDNFLFVNDDHFLLSDYAANEFPYYYRGRIEPGRIGNEAQRVQMENTVMMAGDYIYDYDVHCPILYNKKEFKIGFEMLPNIWPDYGYGIKSYYCNTRLDSGVGEQYDDLKFSEPLMADTIREVLQGRKWFSIGDRVLKNGEMQKVLEGLYPEPSKWETV